MVTELDATPGTGGGNGRDAAPILDWVAVRALAGSRSGARSAARPGWTDAAKHRLYRRMFPDDLCAGTVSHADP